MKIAHQILTVLLIITIVLGLLVMVRALGRYPAGSIGLGVITGNLFAASIIPGIVFIIRYFIGREIKN